MLVSTLLDLKKDDLVLDMAAAPGSKTTHIAQILENSGLIVAVDNNHNRVSKLINNLERMNVKNTVVICCDILEFNIPLKFNKILIDAPCSGNFMLEKEWFEKRKLDDIYQKQEFQKEIIKKSVEFTKPNTKIVYSTCSLEKEENEEIIDYAIKKLGYKLIPIKNTTPFKSILWPGFEHLKKGCLRFWPHHTNQEGFFMCVLEKR
jgi:ribosomal RNA methyltransferase Nop2